MERVEEVICKRRSQNLLIIVSLISSAHPRFVRDNSCRHDVRIRNISGGKDFRFCGQYDWYFRTVVEIWFPS